MLSALGAYRALLLLSAILAAALLFSRPTPAQFHDRVWLSALAGMKADISYWVKVYRGGQ